MKAILAVLAGMVVLGIAACHRPLTPEDARKQLGAMNIQYNEQAFIDCARNGDLTAVNLFLAAGMSPSVRDPLNRVAFEYADTYASIPNDRGPQQAILQYHEAVNKLSTRQPDNPTTALMVATVAGRLEIVRALINKGADIAAKDRLEMNALDYAAYTDRKDIAKALEDAGAKQSPPLKP
jgi:ankyrin repeat protein